MHIKVFNAHHSRDVPIAEAEIPFGFFTEHGPKEDWVEVFHNGQPAGKVHFRSEFHRH